MGLDATKFRDSRKGETAWVLGSGASLNFVLWTCSTGQPVEVFRQSPLSMMISFATG